MRIRRANKLMLGQYGTKLVVGKACLPDRLSEMIATGFVEHHGCVFLSELFKTSKAVTEEDFPDKTGHECFVNHVHIDDFVDSEEIVPVAIIFLARISEMLKTKYPKYEFRGLLSADGD